MIETFIQSVRDHYLDDQTSLCLISSGHYCQEPFDEDSLVAEPHHALVYIFKGGKYERAGRTRDPIRTFDDKEGLPLTITTLALTHANTVAIPAQSTSCDLAEVTRICCGCPSASASPSSSNILPTLVYNAMRFPDFVQPAEQAYCDQQVPPCSRRAILVPGAEIPLVGVTVDSIFAVHLSRTSVHKKVTTYYRFSTGAEADLRIRQAVYEVKCQEGPAMALAIGCSSFTDSGNVMLTWPQIEQMQTSRLCARMRFSGALFNGSVESRMSSGRVGEICRLAIALRCTPREPIMTNAAASSSSAAVRQIKDGNTWWDMSTAQLPRCITAQLECAKKVPTYHPHYNARQVIISFLVRVTDDVEDMCILETWRRNFFGKDFKFTSKSKYGTRLIDNAKECRVEGKVWACKFAIVHEICPFGTTSSPEGINACELKCAQTIDGQSATAVIRSPLGYFYRARNNTKKS